MRHATALLLPLLVAACDKPARVELEPASLRFAVRGQSAKVHARPVLRDGRPAPDRICRWTSTDPRVATAEGPHNEATVTAVGPGAAAVRCTIDQLVAEVPVIVRVVTRVSVKPERVEVRMQDEPAPVALAVAAFDDAGQPVLGRVAQTRCADEGICRGDARGQVWGVAAGTSTVIVEVDGARAELPVRVLDARTAEGKPRRVSGNPMEAIEREVKKRDAEAARAAQKPSR